MFFSTSSYSNNVAYMANKIHLFLFQSTNIYPCHRDQERVQPEDDDQDDDDEE